MELNEILKIGIRKTVHWKKENCNLTDFPLTIKKDIQEKPENFLNSDFNKTQFLLKKTSGSTGVPLNVFKTNGDILSQNLQMWKFRRNYNIVPSDKILYAYLNASNPATLKNGYTYLDDKAMAINITPFLNSLEVCRKIIKEIDCFSPKLCMMPPSVLITLIHYCKKNDIYPSFFDKLSLIELISEPLLGTQKKELLSVFGKIPIICQYGCTEIGLIGIDSDLDDVFTVADSNVYVETVVNNEVGKNWNQVGPLVITGLNNVGMPFIRYLLGDVGMLEMKNGKECLHVLKGRANDYLILPNAQKIHCTILSSIVDSLNQGLLVILSYQFVQISLSCIKVKFFVPSLGERDRAKLCESFINAATQNGIKNIKFDFTFTSDYINNTGETKLRYFKSLL